MDIKQLLKYENYFIAILAVALAVYTFFGTTMTINGVAQAQWLAGITGVAFMAVMIGIAYGAAWGLNWLINAGWKK